MLKSIHHYSLGFYRDSYGHLRLLPDALMAFVTRTGIWADG